MALILFILLRLVFTLRSLRRSKDKIQSY